MRTFSSFYPAAAGGLVLLALAFCAALSLSRGGGTAVGVLLVLTAALACLLVRRSGWDWTRLGPVLPAVGLALLLRALLLDYVTDDYEIFLSQWVAVFRESGGFAAIRQPVGNYNVPYLYFLAAISYLPLPDLYLIKLFSILFDVALAWGGLRLTRHFTGGESLRPLVCFCALLLLPTVILNGACWGQCDAIYGAFVLHALACALEGRGAPSSALLGLAFSFKLQTVFILPLWAVFWMAGRVRFRDLLCFPGAYAATCLPALLLGKPLGDILGVYVGQTQNGAGALNYNCASLFSLLPYGTQVDEALGARVGILAAFALVLALLAAAFFRRRRLDDMALLLLGGVLTIGVPFLLPYMHDRYYYLADVLTLTLACIAPRRLPAAALVELSSLSAYFTYFRMRYTLPIYLGGHVFTMLGESLMVLVSLAWVLPGVGKDGEKNEKSLKSG